MKQNLRIRVYHDKINNNAIGNFIKEAVKAKDNS